MTNEKEILLNNTLDKVYSIGFGLEPDDSLEKYFAEKLMVVGTTHDEQFSTLSGLRKLIRNQKEQSQGIQFQYTRQEVFREFTGNENTAVIVENVGASIKTPTDSIHFDMRSSAIMEYANGHWKLVHWHASKPELVKSEVDTFGIKEWQQKTDALEKLVDERTADLVEKNRELEIEASLERIRSAAMGMQKPDDLLTISEILFKELQAVGFKNLRNALIHTFNDQEKYFTDYDYSEFTGGCISHIPYSGHPAIDKFIKEVRSSTDAFTEIAIAGKELEDWREFRKSNNEAPDARLEETSALYYYFYSVGPADIGISTFSSISVEERELLKRYRNVFDLAYRRYLDIAQAMAQTREAQIEAALEKVRSRSLAMQMSDELKDVVAIVFQKLKDLHIPATAVGISLPVEGSKDLNAFVCGAHETGLVITNYRLPFFEHVISNDLYEALQKQVDFFVGNYSKEEKNSFYTYLFEHSAIKQVPDDIKRMILQSESYTISMLAVEHALFNINDFEGKNLTAYEVDVIKRFANVFDQAYTRFLDLQNAEAQAREAQVELSLERIRAKVTAMQRSLDLLDIVVTMRREFISLGHEAHYFWHMRWQPNTYEKAMTSGDGSRIGMVMELPRGFHNIAAMTAWEGNSEPYAVFALDVDSAIDYVDRMVATARFSEIDPNAPGADAIRSIGGLTFVMARTTHGEIGYSLPGVVANPPAEDLATLVRFAAVFDLAYRRFEDLQSSEKRIREAQIELAIERVRAQTLAMYKSEELAHLSLELVKQVQTLGVNTWFCAFNIYDDDSQGSLEWGSNGQGTFPKYRTPREGIFLRYYEAGQKNEALFINKIGEDECPAHYEYLCTLPGVGEQLLKMKADGIPFPTSQIDHVAYFKYGYIIFITYEPVPEAHDIFKRFAKVFEQTYTRFLDLQKAEAQAVRAEKDLVKIKAARKKAEKALTELRATQKQLIQSEKMASLGELTAGIAHEIQNPLNFVNNFSEVSKELLDEMKAAMEGGDVQEAKALAADIIQNLEKITHHGKRADAIVKGMLQHSRASSNQKEATNINALADEYLRLAYHGLRAKDKSFNAVLKTDYDERIGRIHIVPQDVGRVMLNLITNAFYAVTERKSGATAGYDPTVSLSTKQANGRVEIVVSDNGAGIPKNILDKIFQPFFTTKPTGQGTGLGLSLAYDIIRTHNGELKVESQEGKGTTFTISLPA